MRENFFQILLSSNKIDTPKINNNISASFDNINYKMYKFKDVHQEFYNNSTSEVYKAFLHVNAYAFKADLFRYYLLYTYGGWYSDLNNVFSGQRIDTSTIDFYAFKENILESSIPNSFQNGIIYSKKNNKIIKNALDVSIENILNNFYGHNPLSITGPIVFGNSVYKNYNNIDQLGTFSLQDGSKKVFLLPDNKVFAYYKPNNSSPENNYGAANSGLSGGNNYDQLWNLKKLYGE